MSLFILFDCFYSLLINPIIIAGVGSFFGRGLKLFLITSKNKKTLGLNFHSINRYILGPLCPIIMLNYSTLGVKIQLFYCKTVTTLNAYNF